MLVHVPKKGQMGLVSYMFYLLIFVMVCHSLFRLLNADFVVD